MPTKRQLARSMMSADERARGISPYDSRAWNLRKKARERKRAQQEERKREADRKLFSSIPSA